MNHAQNIQPMYPGVYPGLTTDTEDAADTGPQLPTAPLNTLLGFDLETYQIPLGHLLPSKKVPDGVMSTRKYKQIVSSIREIGLIEPLSVIQPDPAKSEFLLLDGHLRALGRSDELAHSSLRMTIGRWTTEAEIDYAVETIKLNVAKLRDLSPLWDMYQEGIDISTIQWAAH